MNFRISILSVLGVLFAGSAAALPERPNIVWIVVEDMSVHFSCYGEKTIETPNVDGLAAQGALFESAFVTCPVCSPARSAMITGMYQTSIGAHQHRSGRGELRLHLPDRVRTIPDFFKEAGYFVTNAAQKPNPRRPDAIGKTDYNFETADDLYHGNDWTQRAEGQPFFAQYQLAGGKNRNVRSGQQLPANLLPSAADVTLPPYYPDDAVIREDWADYLASVQKTDAEVGEILALLEAQGVADSTVVIFLTDHGVSHARGKQFLYEEGIRVPLIIRAPGAVEAGVRRSDLAAHIDIAATSLMFAGIEIPDYLEARPLFGDQAAPRDFVVSARDRCDETMDRIRSVRTDRFKYIRNFHPDRPHLQPNAYKDNKPVYLRIRELHAAGELTGLPEQLLMAPTRPIEELYDLDADPWETKNLARDPAFRGQLREHRRILEKWIVSSQDAGQNAESMEGYNSDMAEYLRGLKAKRPERLAEITANIALQKKWIAEGK
ncbi:MAG: arylsulfatase A-like enzyme [Verrucomicrobiales bacterium]|jgi:arylsulfatase A-like enzyme